MKALYLFTSLVMKHGWTVICKYYSIGTFYIGDFLMPYLVIFYGIENNQGYSICGFHCIHFHMQSSHIAK